MNSLRAILALLLCFATPSFALTMLAPVDKAKAKELGIEIRVTAAGPDSVRIEVEFQRVGELKNPGRVDLILNGPDGKTLGQSSMLEEKARPGRVLVGFATARSIVENTTVRIVVGEIDGRIAYDLKMKDFVDGATATVKARK